MKARHTKNTIIVAELYDPLEHVFTEHSHTETSSPNLYAQLPKLKKIEAFSDLCPNAVFDSFRIPLLRKNFPAGNRLLIC